MHPIQILLVEDSPADVRLTREALNEAKVANELSVVTNGEDAMTYLRRGPRFEDAVRPDLILLDLNLPRRSGFEVLAGLKANVGLRAIPVAILTTSDTEADVFRSYDLGASCFLTKPVGFPEFLKVIEAIDNFWLAAVRLPPASPLAG